MTRRLHLSIATPGDVLVDAADVSAVRAEDESGSFGILPGHVDLLTVLSPSVVRWRADGGTRYCAVLGGVLTVRGGAEVAIPCREGTVADDLAALETAVRQMREAAADEARRAKVDETRLHANAVRQLMRYLQPAAGGIEAPPPDIAP